MEDRQEIGTDRMPLNEVEQAPQQRPGKRVGIAKREPTRKIPRALYNRAADAGDALTDDTAGETIAHEVLTPVMDVQRLTERQGGSPIDAEAIMNGIVEWLESLAIESRVLEIYGRDEQGYRVERAYRLIPARQMTKMQLLDASKAFRSLLKEAQEKQRKEEQVAAVEVAESSQPDTQEDPTPDGETAVVSGIDLSQWLMRAEDWLMEVDTAPLLSILYRPEEEPRYAPKLYNEAEHAEMLTDMNQLAIGQIAGAVYGFFTGNGSSRGGVIQALLVKLVSKALTKQKSIDKLFDALAAVVPRAEAGQGTGG